MTLLLYYFIDSLRYFSLYTWKKLIQWHPTIDAHPRERSELSTAVKTVQYCFRSMEHRSSPLSGGLKSINRLLLKSHILLTNDPFKKAKQGIDKIMSTLNVQGFKLWILSTATRLVRDHLLWCQPLKFRDFNNTAPNTSSVVKLDQSKTQQNYLKGQQEQHGQSWGQMANASTRGTVIPGGNEVDEWKLVWSSFAL